MKKKKRRGITLVKEYDNCSDRFRLSLDSIKLTRVSARLNIVMGTDTTCVFVECKMNYSTPYVTAKSLGFEEM